MIVRKGPMALSWCGCKYQVLCDLLRPGKAALWELQLFSSSNMVGEIVSYK